MQGVTREELWSAVGLIPTGPPVLQATSECYEEHEAVNRRDNGKLQTSFHASWFPYGDDRKHCGRLQMYNLMNVPVVEDEVNEHGRAIMDAGKDIEQQIVSRWAASGILLTPSDGQLSMTDPDHMLSGYPDAFLDMRRWGWRFAQPVEIKSKDHDVVKKMLDGEATADPYHVGQVMSYAYMGRLPRYAAMWAEKELLPPISGTILYVSRGRPALRCAFDIAYDETEMENALARLKEWMQLWEDGILPPRGEDWKWSEDPCGYCVFKREVCKNDKLERIDKLEDSNLARLAKLAGVEWDLQKIRRDIESRWKKERKLHG